MGFTKLDSGITRSSIWFEPLATRVVWITMLSMCDENGFVATSRRGLEHACNVEHDAFEVAMCSLESPDADSRTPDYEGRRVKRVDGGWIVLNHALYRTHTETVREQTRERVRRYRSRKKSDVTRCNVTDTLPSVSVSVSGSGSEEGGAGGRNCVPPTLAMVKDYCQARGNNIDAATFCDYYTARGWVPKGHTRKMRDWQAAVRTWERTAGGNGGRARRLDTTAAHRYAEMRRAKEQERKGGNLDAVQ